MRGDTDPAHPTWEQKCHYWQPAFECPQSPAEKAVADFVVCNVRWRTHGGLYALHATRALEPADTDARPDRLNAGAPRLFNTHMQFSVKSPCM